jgi:hypothetical protein
MPNIINRLAGMYQRVFGDAQEQEVEVTHLQNIEVNYGALESRFVSNYSIQAEAAERHQQRLEQEYQRLRHMYVTPPAHEWTYTTVPPLHILDEESPPINGRWVWDNEYVPTFVEDKPKVKKIMRNLPEWW